MNNLLPISQSVVFLFVFAFPHQLPAHQLIYYPWWDARVAEWDGFENRYARKGIGGSTPPPTA